MSAPHAVGWTRRRFLGGLTVTGTVGLLGMRPRLAAAEPPPETTRLRLGRTPGICSPPYYLAEEFLPGEGFTEVQWVDMRGASFTEATAAGRSTSARTSSGRPSLDSMPETRS